MNFEEPKGKKIGWVEQCKVIWETLGEVTSICDDIIGTPVSDVKSEAERKEPSNSAERLDDQLRFIQNRSLVILSQLEDIAGKF